jgi:hypothetical protein
MFGGELAGGGTSRTQSEACLPATLATASTVTVQVDAVNYPPDLSVPATVPSIAGNVSYPAKAIEKIVR